LLLLNGVQRGEMKLADPAANYLFSSGAGHVVFLVTVIFACLI
jgi:hypothetical protein